MDFAPSLQPHKPRTQKGLTFWVILSFAVLVVAIVATAWFRMTHSPRPNFAMVASVVTAPVEIRDLPVEYETTGSLEAENQVDLNTETPGTVTRIFFEEGQHVRKGAPLIQLDFAKEASTVTMSSANLAESKAGLSSAQAELATRQEAINVAKAQYQLAQSEYARYQSLFEKSYVSAQDLDEKAATLSVRKAQLLSAQSDEKSAKARLEQAKAAIDSAVAKKINAQSYLGDTTIRAPFDGVIGVKHVDLGDYVIPTEKLVTVVQNSSLKIDFGVPERFGTLLKKGLAVEVMPENLAGKALTGVVVFLNPVVSPDSRVISVKARIENSQGLLQSGQWSTVRLKMGSHPNALVIPEESLVPQGERYLVFVVTEKDGHKKAHMVPVTPGIRKDGQVEILEGLQASDRVIIGGLQKVQDQMDVVEAPPESTTSKPQIDMETH